MSLHVDVSRSVCMTPRQRAVREFRAVVKYMDNKKQKKSTRLDTGLGTQQADGCFAVLEDDCLEIIFCMLLQISNNIAGLEYFDAVDVSRKSVSSLALCCRRFAALLSNTFPHIRAESLARACTRVVPRAPFNKLSFTEQMREELLSCDHLKLLQAAQRAMACHCSRSCCQPNHKLFNSSLRNGAVFSRPRSPTLRTCAGDESRLVDVVDECKLLAVNTAGDSAFIYSRQRLWRERSATLGGGRHFQEIITHVSLQKDTKRFSKIIRSPDTKRAFTKVFESTEPKFVRDATLVLKGTDMSEPLHMRVSPDGKSVAFIRAIHAVDEETETPFSSAWIWHLDWDAYLELPRPQPDSAINAEAVSAQGVWFRTSQECHVTAIVVAWSTDFQHPSGHLSGSNAHGVSPQYFFTTYLVHPNCSETLDKVEILETVFDGNNMLGTLLTCSPTEDGNSVVTLVKRRDFRNGLRIVSKHDLDTGRLVTITAAYMNNGPGGPLHAAVSPNGDCVVTVAKRDNGVFANFCWRTNQSNYMLVQNVDASPWMGLQQQDSTDDLPYDLVKDSIDITFSPCGRFVALVDRHPFYFMPARSHGLVIIDTAMRDKVTKFRSYPMFNTADQAPRSVHWTRQGIWLMPPGTDSDGKISTRGGALCLFAPVGNGFV